MSEVVHGNVEEVRVRHRQPHIDYEYIKRDLIPHGTGKCEFTHYEILPGKSSYPYHYHVDSEEVYFILSGKGIVRTPDGEKEISAGDFIYFPAGKEGAHKLTNTSDSENLVYLDFDIKPDPDICFYPDSNKVGIWGKSDDGLNKLYIADQNVDYFEGES